MKVAVSNLVSESHSIVTFINFIVLLFSTSPPLILYLFSTSFLRIPPPGYTKNIQFTCNHPTACGDIRSGMSMITIKAPLAPDDKVGDGQRQCSIVLKPQPGCNFNFTAGNSLRLVVMDDEGSYMHSMFLLSSEQADLLTCIHHIWQCMLSVIPNNVFYFILSSSFFIVLHNL